MDDAPSRTRRVAGISVMALLVGGFPPLAAAQDLALPASCGGAWVGQASCMLTVPFVGVRELVLRADAFATANAHAMVWLTSTDQGVGCGGSAGGGWPHAMVLCPSLPGYPAFRPGETLTCSVAGSIGGDYSCSFL